MGEMSEKAGHSAKRVTGADLRDAGRQPETPFSVPMNDGSEVVVLRLLRVLPGKRIVGEGDWNGRQVLVKLLVAGGSARHWAKEKSGIDALRHAGILTPDLLVADTLPAGGHILLTTYLESALSLAEAWAPVSALPAGNKAALDVLRPAFRLLGSMHAAGLTQEDLHLGNFLSGDGHVFVIDGDAVRAISPGQPLDEQQAINNLAILLAQLPIGWDACHEALLDAYHNGGGRSLSDWTRIESELERARSRRLNDFLAKTVRDCTLFSVTRSASRFTAMLRDETTSLVPLLESPDRAISQGRLMKDGRTSTVASIDRDGRTLVIKRYNLKNLQHVLGRFWRPSRAWHSWREGHRLQFYGISTPTPLALLEERIGPLRARAFLVNAYCPGSDLMACLEAESVPPNDVAQALLSLFGTLHRLRISHGDLKATNLLWHEGRVWLIDLDAVKQHRSATAFAQAWRRDRVRFLRNWPASSALCQWLDANLPTSYNVKTSDQGVMR